MCNQTNHKRRRSRLDAPNKKQTSGPSGQQAVLKQQEKNTSYQHLRNLRSFQNRSQPKAVQQARQRVEQAALLRRRLVGNLALDLLQRALGGLDLLGYQLLLLGELAGDARLQHGEAAAKRAQARLEAALDGGGVLDGLLLDLLSWCVVRCAVAVV